ncbi:MAG: amidohydrolase family protein [Conexivisphaerales archaeon]
MIDFHVHPWTKGFMLKNRPIMKAVDFFHVDRLPESIDDLIAEMDSAGVEISVILGQDTSHTASPAFSNYTISNEFLRQLVDQHPGRLVAFAGIDPNEGAEALRKLRIAVEEMGFRGLKVHGSVNSIYINDERIYLLCEYCQERGLPVLFHTGTTALGDCQVKYCKPEYIDEIAEQFPDLKIVMAHFGWPWHEVAIAVALRHKNVYMDISGWKPKYIPEIVVRYMNGPLADRFLFGTDYPMIRQTEWVEEFKRYLRPKLKEEVSKKLVESNARNILGL